MTYDRGKEKVSDLKNFFNVLLSAVVSWSEARVWIKLWRVLCKAQRGYNVLTRTEQS